MTRDGGGRIERSVEATVMANFGAVLVVVLSRRRRMGDRRVRAGGGTHGANMCVEGSTWS